MKRLILALLLLFSVPASAALTIAEGVTTDWTAVAAESSGESTVMNIAGNYSTTIYIQAFLDSTTAHEGTEFLVLVSSDTNTSTDEDWVVWSRFTELVGTANSEAITDNPLAADSTTIACADTTGYTMDGTAARWIAIEDATLANSELILQSNVVANTSVSCFDGTTNAHVQNTLMYNIAISRAVVIPMGVGVQAKVVVNNNFDDDGTSSTLNYRVREVEVTGL